MRRLPILLLLFALPALFTACTETGSLPTGPMEPAITSDWSRIYPILVNTSLYAAWGLDADDMWAVGYPGLILHFDGETCTQVDSPSDRSLDDIHGRARDDVWAVGGADILHWDGHRWSLISSGPHGADFSTVWCATGGDVFVGGMIDRYPDPYEVTVLRHDGTRWWPTVLPPGFDGRPRHIWQPEPGGVLLMATDEGLYRLRNSRWTPTATRIVVSDVDGALAVGRHAGESAIRLFRFDADGEPYAACPEQTLPDTPDLADARAPLLETYGTTATSSDCTLVPVAGEIGGSLGDLAVPELLRPTASIVFGVGSAGRFVRGVWNDDLSIAWEHLVPGPTARMQRAVTGTADQVFCGSDWDQMLVREGGTWRLETDELIGHAAHLDILPDGRLVAWGYNQASVRQVDGTWAALPELPGYPSHLWTDGAGDAVLYLDATVEWTLHGGHWARTDSLPDGLRQLGGRSADEVYRLRYPGILEQRVGHRWLHVFGDETDRVRAFYLSPWSDDIYLYLNGPAYPHSTAVLRPGELAILSDEGGHGWDADEVCEARPGDLYFIDHGEMHRLTLTSATGWQPVALDPAMGRLYRVWGHPDQGLFTLDSRGALYHRPFPDTDR